MIKDNFLRDLIIKAFDEVPPPPDWCIVDSNEGDEPRMVQLAFAGITDWRSLSSEQLDRAPAGLGSALSFFSDEAFRYYLQAYLVADLDGGLSGNDMVWRLTNGLTNAAKNDAINPIRYGARTVWDYYTYRYSVFSKDQSMAIVSYLKYKLDEGELMDSERTDIIEALENYWLAR